MAPKQEYTPVIAFTLDFETGGLDCQKSACTQIAIHATRLDTFERLGSFVRYIYPYDMKEIKALAKPKKKVLKSKYDEERKTPMEYSDKALEYSAITMDMLYEKGEDIMKVARDAVEWMAEMIPAKTPKNIKPFIIGQNVGFDEGFFCQLLEYGGVIDQAKKILRGHVDFYGHWHPLVLDTIILGQLALCHLPDVNTYKLEIMSERLGVELDDAHDADADVTATTNVAAILTQRMRSVGGEIEGGGLKISKTEKSRKHFKI